MLGRGKSKCKGPGAGTCLVCPKNNGCGWSRIREEQSTEDEILV